MDGLDDFMAFNYVEDQREEQEISATTEYPYQKQYWDSDNDSDSKSDDSYNSITSNSDYDY